MNQGVSNIPWTAAVGSAIEARLALRAPRLDDLEHWKMQTARVQIRQLRRLVRVASSTEIGREADFASLRDLSDRDLLAGYRRCMPIRDYEGFRDRIGRMRDHAEPDVLWPGVVRHFAQTSGTTSGDKYMPVSTELFRSNYRSSLDIFATLMRWGVPLTRIMSGRCLFLGGSTDLETNEFGIHTGDLSGLVTPMIKWPISKVYSPGPDIALMSDWPAKIEAMAQRTIDQDVRLVSGMPSWAGVLFKRLIELANERGQRASCMRDIWPNLEVFVHGGVNYVPFKPQLAELAMGDGGSDFPERVELYPASEAFVAIQDERGEPGLRLCSDHGIFFEFVPLEQIHDADPDSCTCWEVEPGQRYVVVLSTCGGLFRYILGDVVEFDSFPGDLDGRGGTGPARLRIVGRHRLFINAFGENLIVEQIEGAVAEAAGAVGVRVGEFTAAPVYPDSTTPAGLELAIEAEMSDEQRDRFGRVFDETIRAQNVDYSIKRSEGLGMAEPTITTLPSGAFHRWLDQMGKLGGQHKCPRCANHRDIIESVLAAGGDRMSDRPTVSAGT